MVDVRPGVFDTPKQKPETSSLWANKKFTSGVVAGVAALTTAAVFGARAYEDHQHGAHLKADAAAISRMSDADRFRHDYLGQASTPTHIGQACLSATAYDLSASRYNHNTPAVLTEDSADNDIIVTPAVSGGLALTFLQPTEADQSHHALIPANEFTATTLIANGCRPGAAYGGVQ